MRMYSSSVGDIHLRTMMPHAILSNTLACVINRCSKARPAALAECQEHACSVSIAHRAGRHPQRAYADETLLPGLATSPANCRAKSSKYSVHGMYVADCLCVACHDGSRLLLYVTYFRVFGVFSCCRASHAGSTTHASSPSTS